MKSRFLSTLILALFSILSLRAQEILFDTPIPLDKELWSLDINTAEYDKSTNSFTLYGLNFKNLLLNFDAKEKSELKSRPLGFVNASDIRDRGLTFTDVSAPYTTEMIVSEKELNVVKEAPILLSEIFPDRINPEDSYTLVAKDDRSEKISTSSEAQTLETAKKLSPKSFPKSFKNYNVYQLKVGNFPTTSETTATSLSGFASSTLGSMGSSSMKIGKISTPHTYDSLFGSWTIGEDKVISKNEILFSEKENILRETEPFQDNFRDEVIIPYTAIIPGEDRFTTYKNKRIYHIDATGKVKNKIELKLDFPKDLSFIKGYDAQQDSVSSFKDGALVIYSRANILSKKKNDQDLTRHYAVVLDGQGKTTSQGWFNFGSGKQVFHAYEGFMSNGNYFIFGRLIGGDAPGHVTLKFNSSGFQEAKTFDSEYASKIISGKNEFGLKLYISRNFESIRTDKLGEGKTIIAGHTFETTSKTLPPTGGAAFGETVTTTIYIGEIFVVFDSDGTLINYYSIKASNPNEKSDLTLLHKNGHSIVYYNKSEGEIIVIDLDKNTIKKIEMPGQIYFQKEEKILVSAKIKKVEDEKVLFLKSVQLN